MAKIIKTTGHVQFGAKKDDCHSAGAELEVGKDITAELARELLDKGAATDVTPKKKAAPKDPQADPPAVPTLDEFKAAVAKLTEGAEKHWTQAGLPDCNALESVGGIIVTAAQRNGLWEQANPA